MTDFGDKKILLVRHGRTEWNDEHRFQGQTDVPLNEAGLVQARKTASRLAKWPMDAVYVSPLVRARETAAAIAAPHRKDPIVLDELAEVGFGVWEGLYFNTLGQEMKEWLRDPFFLMPEGAETWESLRLRAHRVKDILFSSAYERVVAVTHGAIMRGLFVALLGLDPHTAWNIRVSNCSLCGIELRKGQASLAFSNDDLHLKEGCDPPKIPLPVW